MDKPRIHSDSIVIPSATEFLSAVDDYIETKLLAAGIDQSVIADIAISVSELVNNAIKHGNRYDRNKEVEVGLRISDCEVMIEVTDQGNGFSLEAIPDPVDDSNLLREVGRGLFIVRNFVDEVHVAAAPRGGTRVGIVKKR